MACTERSPRPTRGLLIGALVVGAAVTHDPRAAHAIAACMGTAGFAPHADTLPRHPSVLFYSDRALPPHAEVIATIDGAVVPTKITLRPDGDVTMLLIEIDSDRVGTLKLGWKDHAGPVEATYRIDGKLAVPTAVNGTTARFYRKMPHSTVREVWDGLAIELDAPALAISVRWRRDAQMPWSTIELPAVIEDGKTAARLGEVGCRSNFTVALLEAGLELEASALLVDGTTRAIAGIPAHVVAPKHAP